MRLDAMFSPKCSLVRFREDLGHATAVGKPQLPKERKEEEKGSSRKKYARGVESTRAVGVGDHPKASQQIHLEYVD